MLEPMEIQPAGPTSMESSITLYGPAVCTIRVRGALSPEWSGQLADLAISVDRVGAYPVTKLAGRLVDQAALHGVLAALYELGMPLLSIACAPVEGRPPATSPRDAGAGRCLEDA